MSLKKTDKIIAIIGVLILIIAGIGIFLYVGTEETTSNEPTEGNIYEVTWVKHTEPMQQTGNLGKRGAYTDPFEIPAQGGIITNVVVYFEWTDARTYGLKHNKGLDTLTAEITLDGGETQTHESVGFADNTTDPKTFTINRDPLDEDITDVTSLSEAEQRINDEYPNIGKVASFQTNIKLKIGEKIWRPLKYILERGDSFTMNIEYTYYTCNINEVPIDGSEPPVESGYPGPLAPMGLPGKS